ncbi:serine-rich adhesin for platelets isoform X2 [Cherax quadricarinatus]|uniref:serine-rich adhesin for platelets isoform X2 n=1 Tax=Cherax quadricarinatus TaxID=27406 RepID=UPI00387E7457
MSKGFLHSLKNITHKHGQDTRMRFSVAPLPGDSGFTQWHDAMMMCARLPGGIPQEFRRRLWLTLAEKHLQARGVSWPHAEAFCFNEWSNPDDDDLGDQIVKDLHRTGCSLFCGEEAEDNQAMLKRVLLAFARWNKGVGYCQGFNMLAAIILEVMERQESDALKVMIYLIEGVLPESYFANNLRGLSVDMAVFRDLLRLRLPLLSRHLEHLQHDAADLATGTSYEPPLTNVFTMQWFLTLFSNCLPRETVMRVWDLTFLQGDEVLLRTALAIWDGLAERILEVHSADEFYTVMGVLTREMLTFGLMDANHLVQMVVGIAPFPFPGLAELRDKYTYNITPWTQSVSSVAKRGLRLFYSDDDDDEDNDEDGQKIAVATAFGLAGIFRKNMDVSRGPSPVGGVAAVSPSAFTSLSFPSPRHTHESRDSLRHAYETRDTSRHTHETREISRPNLDISALKKQYARLRERQKQAHIILTASQQRVSSTLGGGSHTGGGHKSTPLTMNHLLRGKKALTSKTRRVVPQGVIPVIKPKKKAERKLSDSTGTRSTPQQPKQSPSIRSSSSPKQSTQRLSSDSQDPPKVETLHWKDTPRRDRRASLPSGVKLLEGATPSLGTLGVPSEIDDDDGGSSTSTELCDDEEQDNLSDIEVDPSTEPRPATTSPRLETVHENSKATLKSKEPQSEGLVQDKALQLVSHETLPSIVQLEESKADTNAHTIQKAETIINISTADQVMLQAEPQKENSTQQLQEPVAPVTTEPPLWDFKSMETGIPLEDLLAGKNLTAAEIIARIPFPSDVSFMQPSSEGTNKFSSEIKSGILGSSSPFATQHNVTPERSPVDSPVPRITSPDIGYESSLTTKPSPNVSPSKSLSSTPSPRASPNHKSSRSPSKSPNLSPSQSQDNLGFPKLTLVGLPPVSTSDITQDSVLIPPKSPKITVEDEKRNIFEIYTGHPSPVTSHLHPSEEENVNELYFENALESISSRSETCPDLTMSHQKNMGNDAGSVTVTPEYEKVSEVKVSDASVTDTSDNLEKKFEDAWDTKIHLESSKDEFTWLKDSYNEPSDSENYGINASPSTKDVSQTSDSIFDAICQRLKENVAKTESEPVTVETNFATKSEFLCLTVSSEDSTYSGAQKAAGVDLQEASLDVVQVKTSGCTSPVISTPTEALNTSSWLSSFTMTVNSGLIPLSTSDNSLDSQLSKPSEAGNEMLKATFSKEVTEASFENTSSPIITASEAKFSPTFMTVDSDFSKFMKTYSSTSSAAIDNDEDTHLLKGKLTGNLASQTATILSDGITSMTTTTIASCISPVTTFDNVVSPKVVTSESMLPCISSGISEFTKAFECETVLAGIDKDLYTFDNTDSCNFSAEDKNTQLAGLFKNDSFSTVASETGEYPLVTTSNDCQIFSMSESESVLSSPTMVAEGSTTVELSLVSFPTLHMASPATSTHLTFSIPSGEVTSSNISSVVTQETSTPKGISWEESCKTPIKDLVMDSDTSLEKEILSLIGKDSAASSESVAEKCEASLSNDSVKEVDLENRMSPVLSLEERILALLTMDESTGTSASCPDRPLPHKTLPLESSKLPSTTESEERHMASSETSSSNYSSITAREDAVTSSPVQSLSASLEGRLSFITNEVKDEGEETRSYGRLSEAKERKNSDDYEAEAETDFFNGKDLSSEAIRQRLWRGVKSLSLDADITLDPNVFCFLIQQSSRQRNQKDDERKLPRRRNSEVALQELVKENTEIIERILKQKSVEGSSLKKIDTPLEETKAMGEGFEKKAIDISFLIKPDKEKSESDKCVDSERHKATKSLSNEAPLAATLESHEEASSSVKGVSQAVTQVKVTSQSSKPFMPEWKPNYRREDSSTAISPTRPITFNPFPTRNVPRQPKEVAVKLGLYSPTKKTPDNSPS